MLEVLNTVTTAGDHDHETGVITDAGNDDDQDTTESDTANDNLAHLASPADIISSP